MITALVQLRLPQPVTREKAKEVFLGSAPKHREVPGLVRKYYRSGNLQVDVAPFDIERNGVLQKRERPAVRGLGRGFARHRPRPG